uniref:Uncharacterized protein n=1 Tax=Timema douglasi TaxID=61478 RepID=A0A7R8ZEH0_TIMDO|nr:unnamed protein product [Timema douglasi]
MKKAHLGKEEKCGKSPMHKGDIFFLSSIRGGRGKSLESLEDGSVERTHHTFSAENTQTFYYQHQVGGWRPRSYDDGDITPTNEAIALHEGGGTLPRPRGLVRPRPVAKIIAKTRQDFAVQEFEKPPAPAINYCGTYKSSPREMIDISKYNLENYSYRGDMPPPQKGNESPRCTPKKRPPSPPKRQSSRGEADIVIDCSGPIPTASDGRNMSTVTVDLHSSAPSPLLPLPSYPSSDALDSGDDLPLPPPPAPSSPPLREKFDGLSSPSLPPILTRSWGVGSASAGDLQSASAVEQELIASLALQQSRNGSDASFKSSSSTESDSLPFANENAGTIKQRTARPHPTLSTMDYPQTGATSSLPPSGLREFVPPLRSQHSATDLASSQKALRERAAGQEPADVLNDIGNMLANLTDELDAMLEEEKRQGLNQ